MSQSTEPSSTDLNEASRAAWNESAGNWDEARDRGMRYQDVLIDPPMLRMLGPVDGLAIVDAGCGNGHLARKLADLGARVTAFDFAEDLIARAESRSSRYGDRIAYRVIDATDAAQLSALPEGAVDAVTCGGVLMTLTAIDPLISAAHRWLKPGGVFVFAVSHPCFNTDRTVLMAESVEDARGERRTVRSVKVSGYKSVVPMRAPAFNGTASSQVYIDRPLEALLGAFFAHEFVMEAIEEPSFPDDSEAPMLEWRGMPEIPPVFAARMRRQA